jgi:hypothetical protein
MMYASETNRFYCPNSTTILPCPSDHWCAEGTTVPQTCDSGSSCGEMSYYEVNIINLIIALIASFIIAISSYYLNRLQRIHERQSKEFDYKTAMKSNRSVSHNLPNDEGVEVLMMDYSYEVLDSNRGQQTSDMAPTQSNHQLRLLSNVTTKFNAGSITCILGPSGCKLLPSSLSLSLYAYDLIICTCL